MAELTLQRRKAHGDRARTPWRYLVVGLFASHGVVHTMGFAATWRLGQITAIPTTPAFPPGLSAGSPIALVLGVFWVTAAVGFIGAAVGLAISARGWRFVAAGAALLSLLLCLAWWNTAPVGVAIDVAILIGAMASAWTRRRRLGG